MTPNNKAGFCIKCDRWVVEGKGIEKEKGEIKVIYCRGCDKNGKAKISKNRE